MGEKVARKNQVDSVWSPDGSAICCPAPSTQATQEGATNVLANNVGVVREGDAMKTHPYDGPCCVPHSPTLNVFSEKVIVNNKGLGRVTDKYSGHRITTGSYNVEAG